MAINPTQVGNRTKSISRFALIFGALTVILFLLKISVKGMESDFNVLLAGNIVLFLATVISFIAYGKSLQSNNPHVFLKFIYAGIFSKMIVCLVAAMVYIFMARGNVSKFGLFGCFVLYIIYTFVEVKILTQLSKQQKNV